MTAARSIIAFLSMVFAVTSSAFAAFDPCSLLLNQQSYAERAIVSAQNFVAKEQGRLDRLQETISFRQLSLQNEIEQARIYASSYAGTNPLAECYIGGRFRCTRGEVGYIRAAQQRAQSRYNLAVARYNSYVQFAQLAVQRQAQRIVDAQNRYTQSTANYQNATAALQQCISTPPQTTSSGFQVITIN